MKLARKIAALKLPNLKGTAGMKPVSLAAPPEVLLPMTMHSGSPAVPVVAAGDHVRVGQLIAKEDGSNSAPVHATISGKVKSIEPFYDGIAIRIESDGKMEPDPSVKAPEVHTTEEFLAAVRKSGIVGLGGAAFPVWAKLDAVRKAPIKTVLINGAECEPYITSDYRTMMDHSHYIVKGIELLKEYLKSEEFIIGIETNKPDAITKMREAFAADSSVTIKPLESVYPQGANQVLLWNTTGKVVSKNQRLSSLGVIILNVTSLAKIAEFMETGMPLVERTLTVEGTAVKEPKNVTVPIGTPIRYLLEQSGGLKAEAGKVIYGGPMMGKDVKNLEDPILKATNAILVMAPEPSVRSEANPCIRCGRCVAACPLNLNPTLVAKAMDLEEDAARFEMLEKASVTMCMSCGSCSYVCPASRPLAEFNEKAKIFVREYLAMLSEQRKEGANE